MTPQTPRDQHRTALFAGSFDPLTLGHLDLIQRASRLFHTVVVAIGEAQGKSPVFTVSERLEQITAACSGGTFREVIVCRVVTICAAATMGSMVRWGAAP